MDKVKFIKIATYIREYLVLPLVFNGCAFTAPSVLKGRLRKISAFVDENVNIVKYNTPLLRDGKRLVLRAGMNMIYLYELYRGTEMLLFESNWTQETIYLIIGKIQGFYKQYFYTNDELKQVLEHRLAWKRIGPYLVHISKKRKRDKRVSRPCVRHFYETDDGVILWIGTANIMYKVAVYDNSSKFRHELTRYYYDGSICHYSLGGSNINYNNELNSILSDYEFNKNLLYSTANFRYVSHQQPEDCLYTITL